MGDLRAQCRIWIGDELLNNAILYSHGRQFGDNSYNESLYAQHDGFRFYLEPTMIGFHMTAEDQKREKSPEEAAEYLWLSFTRSLVY